jgi:DNA invertase Pin-like site-specific DNA recombinase
MPKAYSYLRFSTPEQAKGDSKRRQWELAKNYAEKNGLELDEELTFHDAGVSAYRGANIEIGRLGEFIDAVDNGIIERGSYLLVESIDRLSRDFIPDAQGMLLDLCRRGITIVTVGNVGNETVLSMETMRKNTFLTVEVALILIRANEESEQKALRSRSNWKQKRSNILNKLYTGKLPGWLELCGNKIVAIPERAAIVQRIFDLYLKGSGPKGIAHILNSEKINTWGVKKRKAEYWHHSYIFKILGNPATIGVLIPHETKYVEIEKNDKKLRKKIRVPQEAIKNYFPPVVDEKTFNRVQEFRENNNGMKGMKLSIPLRNIFSRLAKCPLCESNLIRVSKGDGQSEVYLACGKAKAGAGCDFYRVRYDEIESVFIPAFSDGLMKLPRQNEKFYDINKKLKSLRITISTYEDELNNLVEAVKRKKSERLEVEIARIEDEKKLVEKELKKTIAEHISLKPTVVEHKIKQYLACITTSQKQGLDIPRLNALLRSLCHKVVVDDIYLYVKFNHGPVQEISRVYNRYRFINQIPI